MWDDQLYSVPNRTVRGQESDFWIGVVHYVKEFVSCSVVKEFGGGAGCETGTEDSEHGVDVGAL